MAIIRSFRDLRAYQQARREAGRIFEVTKTFPKEEKYSLTDQIRRSSRAVKAMGAEAWARRRYPASFACKLTDAIGEANETPSWLDDALDCGYIAVHIDIDTPGSRGQSSTTLRVHSGRGTARQRLGLRRPNCAKVNQNCHISPAQHKVFEAAWQSVGGMIANMILKADDFCGTKKD